MQREHLIIGHGDIGRRTAELLNRRCDHVTLVGRQGGTVEEVSLQTRLIADLDKPGSLVHLPLTSGRILYLAPPPPSGDVDLRMHNFCDELTRRLPELPQGIVYISTSGVYGNCDGDRVDEKRPVNPQTDRARRRVDAEDVLRRWGASHRVPVVILRVAGIYGPGRLPVQRLKQGMPVLQPEQAPFSNRIHADDLARICLAALDRVEQGGVFNVCDGERARMSDYFITVAKIFDLPSPRLISLEDAEQELSSEMLSYLNESRQLSNDSLLKELNINLLYPTLESGLRSIKRQLELKGSQR